MENDLFERIYDETKYAARRYIAANCFDIRDIEDIFQETYLAVYRSVMNLTERIENSEAYVIAVAKRVVPQYYSAIAKLRSKVSTSLAKLTDKELTEDIPDEVDIEDLTVDKALVEDIFREISSQPKIVGKIFYLRYVSELSVKEIAAELGLGEQSVKQRLYRTLSMIRRSYKRRDML